MSGAPEPVLTVRDLTVALPAGADRGFAVQDVSLEVRPREIVCVVGESGSGKSITALSIMGLLPRNQFRPTGTVLLQGEDLLAASPARLRELRGSRMAMIFQEPMTALNPVLPVGRQVAEVFDWHKPVPDDRAGRVRQLFADVHLPEPERLQHAYPHQLSGGQRQRVMIAMALALDPALIVADEPTTALDVTTQAQILHLLRELQASHDSGVLFITHDFGVVAEIADRVVVMRAGHVVESGPAGQVLTRPEHPYTRMLIDAVPSTDATAARSLAPGAVLEGRGVAKSYTAARGLFRPGRTVPALAGVDLAVRRGETLGVVGESGSGKSTLARCLARLIDPDAGEIRLDGVDIGRLPAAALRPHRRRIQTVFQDPYRSLNPRRTVGRSIVEGPMNYGVAADEAWRRAHALLALVGLDPVAADRYPHQFSGGQRQRICIARALAVEPDVLIADEPVSALDVSVQAQVLDLLEDVRERLGLAMLFVTHDLRVAARICDRIMVMHRGQVVEEGPTAEVFAAPRHDYTRALFAATPGAHRRAAR